MVGGWGRCGPLGRAGEVGPGGRRAGAGAGAALGAPAAAAGERKEETRGAAALTAPARRSACALRAGPRL